MVVRKHVIELRDPVHGAIPVSPEELAIIDEPLFQRLRSIRQLGFAELVYPGAVHNRYLHSVGAMHVAGLAFDRVFAQATWLDEPQKQRFRAMLRCATLLHDVGHAPFSHAAESLMPLRESMGLEAYGVGPGQASHEEMGLKIIVDSELSKCVDSVYQPLDFGSQHVAAVLGLHDTSTAASFEVGGIDHRPLLHALVSGELDVDRMDYLLRDSYFAGVSYGRYDATWLLSNLQIYIDPDQKARLAFGIGALPAFEHFLLARYHMFQMVYFHPKSDIYDAMLKRWLQDEGDSVRFPPQPEDFVNVTDAWLMARLRESDNPWAQRILHRDPLSLAFELRTEVDVARKESLDATLASAGIECLWLKASHVLSKYAQSPAKLARNPIYVFDPQAATDQKFTRVDRMSDLFDRYEKHRSVQRCYVAADQRAAARKLFAPS